MQIDPAYILLETEHWQLNHHLTTKLPGYLMLGAKAPIMRHRYRGLAKARTRATVGSCVAERVRHALSRLTIGIHANANPDGAR